MKRIRKRKKPVRGGPARESDAPGFVKRAENFVRENAAQVAIVSVVIVCLIVVISVYSGRSRGRENTALRALEKASADESLDASIAQLETVVDEYGGTASSARALYYLGNAYYEREQYDRARACYENYLRKYPRGHFAQNALEGLGYVAESEGRIEEAIEHYAKLLETYGDGHLAQHAWHNIGRCLEQNSDWDSAAEAYEKQISLYPMSAWADKAQEKLDELPDRLSAPELLKIPERTGDGANPAESSESGLD